jgi:hypothetical protein
VLTVQQSKIGLLISADVGNQYRLPVSIVVEIEIVR